jgi:DNA-binding transcriptional LysR family regulator
MGLEIRAMRHLLALGDRRHFARAARELSITQPALSRSIQAIEAKTGTKLFDRSRTGVTPTEAGQLLLDLVRPIVNEADEADRQLRQMVDAQSGRIRIGAGPYAADISLGWAAGLLSRQRPGIRIDLTVDDWRGVARSLLNSDVDVAVAEISEVENDDRLHIEPLPKHRAELFVLKGHALARRRGLSLDDVAGFPLVATELPLRLAELFRRRTSRRRSPRVPREGTPDIRVDTFGLVHQIVEHGDAVGIALRSQLRSSLRAGRFVILPLRLPWLTSNYGIMRLAGRTPSPLVVEFMNILRDVENDIPGD